METMTQNSKSTQRMRIMRHLEDFGTLTSLEAMKEYGIMCLPSRISELRARGEKIEKTRHKKRNDTYSKRLLISIVSRFRISRVFI